MTPSEAHMRLSGQRELTARVMARFDGSFTSVLAAIYGEPIEARILRSLMRMPTLDEQALLGTAASVVERVVVLRGKATKTPVLFGASVIASDRLPSEVLSDLEGGTPLGTVLLNRSVATVRNEIDLRPCPEGHEAHVHLGTQEGDVLLQRTTVMEASDGPLVLLYEVCRTMSVHGVETRR